MRKGALIPSKRVGSEGAFDLERYTPYLLNRVGLQIAFDISREIRHFRIKYSHLRVLLALYHYGALRIIDVATLTNFELSTLSRVVVDLEKKGLINRVKSNGKARARRISLLPKGLDLVKRLLPIALSHEASAIRGLSDGERALLIELLHRMRANLEAKSRQGD